MITPAVISQIKNSGRLPTNGLVAWYPFEAADLNGTMYLDRSGNGNHLSIFNSPTNVRGQYGNACQFVRASSQYATASHSTSTNITGAFTLMLWCNFTAQGFTNIFPDILGKETDYTGYSLMWLSTIGIVGQIGSSNGTWYNTVSYIPTANTWNHIAIRYDGSAFFSMWVNGVRYGTDRNIGNHPPTTNTNPLHMSAHYSNPATYGYLDNIADDARVYNRALSDYEMGLFKP